MTVAIRQQEDFRPNADKSLYEDRMRYLVRCAHFRDGKFIGTYWAQRDEAATDKATTLVDLASGRWDHPLQVIEFNSVEHSCSDVSEDFAIEIARRAEHESERTLGRAAYEFCECHGGAELVRGLRVA
jgi:hypothetical protein